jgi:putative membrane protein
MASHPICNKIQAFVLSAIVSSPAILVAQATPAPQQPGQTPSATMPGATTTPESANAPDNAQSMRDRTFLRKASEGGLAEVQFGKLAAEKGASDDVKNFGQKMVDDHTKLNEKMAPIASSMGVSAPKHLNKEDQAEYNKLNSLSGDDFDKEYIAAMVKDHHTDLREFRQEATSTTDPTLKQAVDDGASVIHDHMVMIDKIAQNKGIAAPGTHGKSSLSSKE